jgi:uncharacterized protein (DUF736 family)
MLEEISILKPSHIALQTQLGDFDQRTILRQIELWGSKIIPAIRRELRANQRDYVRAVKKLAAFLGRSPDTATAEDLRAFQLHLTATGVQPPTINATVTVLRFFLKVTLDQGWTVLNRAEIDIVPNRDESADTHTHPDFRIVTQGVEIGAGWIRRGNNSGRDYVSLSLAVPGFVLRKLNVGFNDR